jgi:hypothetical protein
MSEITTAPDNDGGDAVSTLTGQALDHLAVGNKDAAIAAFAKRDEIARGEAGEPGAPADRAPEAPAEPGADDQPTCNYDDLTEVAAMLTEHPGKVGAELVKEWGGPNSPMFKENVGYAVTAANAFETAMPGLKEALNIPLQLPDGSVFHLGNDPLVIKIAAALGRGLADNTAPEPTNNGARPQSPAQPARSAEDIDADIERLLEDAPIGSRKYASNKFQDKLQALYAERYGGPIVGARLRTI